MKLPLLSLQPNRVRRNYAGGLLLDRWENRLSPRDGPEPEDWLASTTPAVNSGMPRVPSEGLGRVRGPDGQEIFLADLFRDHGTYYLGRAHVGKLGSTLGFLAKLLDSSMRLHTQVHPTREFAQTRLGSPFGKLECYVILGVRPGFAGNIRLGFQRPPTRDAWREIMARQEIGRMDACFDPIPVAAGEVWWVPGGMVHALGAGLLLMEVMEPSDLVVRCEFERDGIVVPPEARYMGHDLEFCLDVFDYSGRSKEDVAAMCRIAPETVGQSARHQETLCLSFAKTRCFEVRRLCVRGSYVWPAQDAGRLVVVAKGTGTIRVEAMELTLREGTRFFLAAETDSATVTPASTPHEFIICQASGG